MDETVLVVQTTLQIKVPDCVNKGREKIYRRWNDERQPGCLIHTFYKRIRKNPCTRWAKKECVFQKTLLKFPMIQRIESILSFPQALFFTENLKSFHFIVQRSKNGRIIDRIFILFREDKKFSPLSLNKITHKCCNRKYLSIWVAKLRIEIPSSPENCNPNLNDRMGRAHSHVRCNEYRRSVQGCSRIARKRTR